MLEARIVFDEKGKPTATLTGSVRWNGPKIMLACSALQLAYRRYVKELREKARKDGQNTRRADEGTPRESEGADGAAKGDDDEAAEGRGGEGRSETDALFARLRGDSSSTK